jgi:hypothetical protein
MGYLTPVNYSIVQSNPEMFIVYQTKTAVLTLVIFSQSMHG